MTTIRNREELWIAVNAALDARRDPMDSEPVARWLVEHQDDLEAVLRLDRGLRAIGVPTRRRFSRRSIAVASTAASVAAITAFLVVRTQPYVRPAAPPRSGRSEVLDYRLTVSTETPTTRESTTLSNGDVVREQEQRTSDPGGPSAVAALTITTRREGSR